MTCFCLLKDITMSDSVRDLLVRGVAAAKASDKDEARFYLEWALRLDPSTDQTVEACFWLSEISDDPQEMRDYLEEVLVNQPNHYPARRSLAILDGRLNPEDIVDPNQMPQFSSADPTPVQAQRFVCPNCGGRLTYAPDGKSLVCEYCQAQERLSPRAVEDQVEAGQDFTIALATARGHARPVDTQSFECRACGAVYMLAPHNLSLTCPYCSSVYVIEQTEIRQLIPPEQIIPFTITKEDVQKLVVAWVKEQRYSPAARVEAPRGFYLPVWAFTISGLVPYRYWEDDEDKPKSGEKLFSYRDVPVFASNKIPEIFSDEGENYRLEALVSYDPAYLADWPAETYQISLSDASLKARWIALERARSAINREISKPVRQLNLNSMDLLIETFKLILVPLWISRYRLRGDHFLILINGQTGRVRSERPAGRAGGLFSWLFGDE